MRTTKRIAIILALLAGLALTTPAAAATARPMSGSFTGSVFFAEPRCGDLLTVGFAGTGHATHLGRMTGGAPNCTTFDLGQAGAPVLDGVATFIAADGSAITVSYVGAQQAPVNGIATYANTATVTGGTGRFADASGSWTISGEIDFTTGTISGSLTGWLAY